MCTIKFVLEVAIMKEKIIDLINQIDNEELLEFLYEFIKSAIKKWGSH